MIENPRRFWVRACLVAAALGAAMVAAPFAFEIDFSDGGGALVMVGLMIGLTGLIAAWAFYSDSAKLDALIAGQGVLARWSFPPARWAHFVELECAEESVSKVGLAVLVTVIALAIGVPVAIAEPDAAPAVLGVLALVLGLCWVLALVLPGRRLKPARPGEDVVVLIGRDGVYLPGEFHCWTSLGASFDGAALRPGEDPVVVFEYRIRQRHGFNHHTVRVPVPDGAWEEAQRVVAALG